MTDEITNEGINKEQGGEPPKWWIDEGMPGSGNRPDWLPEKFKTVADMSRGYNELEKSLGYAPDKYDFTKSKYLDPEYASFHDFQEYARSKRVPQDVVDKMLGAVDKYFDEFSTDEAEEFKKLGDGAKDRITTLNNWAKANLSQESFFALTSSIRTADSVKAIEELRSKMMSNQQQIPPGNEAADNGVSMEEIQAELSNNLDKYKTDPKYRKELEGRMALASKNSGFVDKFM